jgi:hypothetical protein
LRSVARPVFDQLEAAKEKKDETMAMPCGVAVEK